MSELSSLSHEYAANASFAEELNAAVLRLKKARLRTPETTDVSSEALKDAREKAADALESLLMALDAMDRTCASKALVAYPVPEEVTERIRRKYQAQFHDFIDDLKRGIAVLRSGAELDDGVLQIVDDICDVADAMASMAFRRLWRR